MSPAARDHAVVGHPGCSSFRTARRDRPPPSPAICTQLVIRVAVRCRDGTSGSDRRHRPRSARSWSSGLQFVPGRHVGIGPPPSPAICAQLVIGFAVRCRDGTSGSVRRHRPPSDAAGHPGCSSFRTARRDRSAAVTRDLAQLVIRVCSSLPGRHVGIGPPPSPAIWRSWSSGLQFVPGRHVGIGPPPSPAISRSWSSGLQFVPGRHVGIGPPPSPAICAQLGHRVCSSCRDGTSGSDRRHRPPSGAAGHRVCSWCRDGTSGSARRHRPRSRAAGHPACSWCRDGTSGSDHRHRLPSRAAGHRVCSWCRDGTSGSARRHRPRSARSWSSGLQLVPGRHVGIGPPPSPAISRSWSSGLQLVPGTTRRDRPAAIACDFRSWSSGSQLVPGRHVGIGPPPSPAV